MLPLAGSWGGRTLGPYGGILGAGRGLISAAFRCWRGAGGLSASEFNSVEEKLVERDKPRVGPNCSAMQPTDGQIHSGNGQPDGRGFWLLGGTNWESGLLRMA